MQRLFCSLVPSHKSITLISCIIEIIILLFPLKRITFFPYRETCVEINTVICYGNVFSSRFFTIRRSAKHIIHNIPTIIANQNLAWCSRPTCHVRWPATTYTADIIIDRGVGGSAVNRKKVAPRWCCRTGLRLGVYPVRPDVFAIRGYIRIIQSSRHRAVYIMCVYTHFSRRR